MDLPFFLSMRFLRDLKTEEELLTHLQDVRDKITFLLAALEDETWTEKHPTVIRVLLQELTEAVFYDRIDQRNVQKILEAIRAKFSLIQDLLPQNIKILIGEEVFLLNSLILGGASPYFQERIRRECRGVEDPTLTLQDLEAWMWQDMLEYMQTGQVLSLWKRERKDLLEEHQKVQAFEIEGLKTALEEILKRYIDMSNVVDTLILAYTKNMPLLRRICQKKISEANLGVNLPFLEEDWIAFEFLDFKEESQDLFKKLCPFITHLIAAKDLPEDPFFVEAMESTPHLKRVDVSRSFAFSENLLKIPKQVVSLDLSMCPWLAATHLQKLSRISPELKELKLRSNIHLHYLFWRELNRFKNLRVLDISRCHQVTDDDFKILLAAAGFVDELFVEECNRLSELSFFEIPSAFPHLFSLNLSRCLITDAAAIEIGSKASYLTFLSLERCPLLSEKGILELVRLAKKLKELNISGNHFSEDTVLKILKINPYLILTKMI